MTDQDRDALRRVAAMLKSASDERYKQMREWDADAAKWQRDGDMYGWNFFKGMAAGANEVDINYRAAMRKHDYWCAAHLHPAIREQKQRGSCDCHQLYADALRALVSWAETVSFPSDRGIAALGRAKALLAGTEAQPTPSQDDLTSAVAAARAEERETCAREVEAMTGGMTCVILTAEEGAGIGCGTDGVLTHDIDGPWFLKSEIAQRIRQRGAAAAEGAPSSSADGPGARPEGRGA